MRGVRVWRYLESEAKAMWCKIGSEFMHRVRTCPRGGGRRQKQTEEETQKQGVEEIY